MGSHLGLVEVYSFEWSSVRGSLRSDAKDPHFRSFRVIDGCVMEESVVVLDNNS